MRTIGQARKALDMMCERARAKYAEYLEHEVGNQ
jgi:hypothetical protein